MTRARDLAAFVSNADGDIKFDTDTLFIDSSANRVGIGTTTPDGILDITGSGNTDVYINTGNNSGDNSRIFFGDTADIDVGYLAYDHGTNKMVFGVNAGNRMFIDNSGDVHIADNANGPDAALHIEKTTPQVRLQLNGNSGYNTIESGGSNELIIGRSGTEQLRVLSGGGLTFNGDTAAANALDDYEYGTWTPVLTSNGGSLTISSYSTQAGAYIKIGDMVWAHFDVQATLTASTGVGRVSLPVTSTLSGAYYPGPCLRSASIYPTLTAGQERAGYVEGSVLNIQVIGADGGEGNASFQTGSNKRINGWVVYQAA